MGEGKYLGQRGKFCVMLFDRQVQLERYLKAYAGISGPNVTPRRHEFSTVGSLAFATASECHNGLLFGEVHMHAHLVGQVVKNLTVGYKNNLIELPRWWVEGLGHWYRRKMDPKINSFLTKINDLSKGRLATDYPPPDYILVGPGPYLIVPRPCETEEEFQKLVAEQSEPSPPLDDPSPSSG